MLYLPWQHETDILEAYDSYEQAFHAHADQVKANMAVYEPMSAMLEAAVEEREAETFD